MNISARAAECPNTGPFHVAAMLETSGHRLCYGSRTTHAAPAAYGSQMVNPSEDDGATGGVNGK